jgi:germination protein M
VSSSATTSVLTTSVPVSSQPPGSTAPPTTVQPSTTAAVTTEPTTTSSASTSSTTSSTVPAGPPSVLVYFLRDELLQVAGRTVPAASPEAALRALLDGPTPAERAAGVLTVIPAGTRLLGVDLDYAAHEAVVDLSGEFAEGGGSLSLVARVMQVVYTVTQFPGVDLVRFRLDGQPVVDLGGEGLYVDGLTRDRYDWIVPVVLLERPAPGAEVGRSIRVVGQAFATGGPLRVEVLDATGARVLETSLAPSVPAGDLGEFDVVLPALGAGVDGQITVRISDPSADPADPRARPAEVVVTV